MTGGRPERPSALAGEDLRQMRPRCQRLPLKLLWVAADAVRSEMSAVCETDPTFDWMWSKAILYRSRSPNWPDSLVQERSQRLRRDLIRPSLITVKINVTN
jgi:hypothetical protein